MHFHKTNIEGAYIIELEPRLDERGFFARSFCKYELLKHGVDVDFVQENISLSKTKGTLRGLHYQIEPHAEDKLICCNKGRIFDIAVDMRPESATYLRWQSVELSSDNLKRFFIPKGVAHGFQTLEDNSEIRYLVSSVYAPDCERGAMWNDPLLRIEWPLTPTVVSEKDQRWPQIDS